MRMSDETLLVELLTCILLDPAPGAVVFEKRMAKLREVAQRFPAGPKIEDLRIHPESSLYPVLHHARLVTGIDPSPRSQGVKEIAARFAMAEFWSDRICKVTQDAG